MEPLAANPHPPQKKTKKKGGKPRLGESMLKYIVLDTPYIYRASD